MATYANQAAFGDDRSRLVAIGTDLSPDHAIVDPRGGVLAHARTGGMIDPKRYVLKEGSIIFRFGGDRPARDVAKGGWWLEKPEFQQLVNFAISFNIHLGLAMRVLCLVPPEWSDASQLVRARVTHPLLAWRGLGNSVVTPMKGGKGTVRLPHQNEISARRLHQLYVPGLASHAGLEAPISIEDVRHLDKVHGLVGFLYL